MKLLVVGTGYVGLVTGTCFAEQGFEVRCLDIDEEKIQMLNQGHIPIYEPGLEEMVTRNVEAGRLSFSTDYRESVQGSRICFLAVDTPPGEDGAANMSTFFSAATMLADHLESDAIIVSKSTVPVGTHLVLHQLISDQLKVRGKNIEIDVVSNPEFLKEGNAVQDFLKPHRVIIGTDHPDVFATMKSLYTPFMMNHERVLWMDPLSAEITKYAANSMLAARISMMNEFAGICEGFGANINHVRRGIGSDPRIGNQFLYAGAGYGGSCFPKDIQGIRHQANQAGCSTPLLDAIHQVNEKQKEKLAEKIFAYYTLKEEDIRTKTIAILGLSFKPDTDDIRSAPSLILIERLLAAGASLRLYDPVAMDNARNLIPDTPQIHWANSEYDAADGADAIALVTEWKQFRFLDFPKILPTMKGHAFFDGRNQYPPEEMEKIGFDYFSMGRPPKAQSIYWSFLNQKQPNPSKTI